MPASLPATCPSLGDAPLATVVILPLQGACAQCSKDRAIQVRCRALRLSICHSNVFRSRSARAAVPPSCHIGQLRSARSAQSGSETVSLASRHEPASEGAMRSVQPLVVMPTPSGAVSGH